MDQKPVKEEPSENKKTPDRSSPTERTSKSPDSGGSNNHANSNSNNNGGVSSPQPSLPPPPTASPSNNSVSSSSRQHHATPIMTNSTNNVQRPPSTSSVHSNTSNSAPRTTTTSRRGGRTRCRSPPAMTNRPASSNQDYGGPSGNGDSYPSGGAMDDRRNDMPGGGGGGPSGVSATPPSPANPSPHAAAAAAAAKALSSNGSRPPPPSSWYNEHPPDNGGSRDYSRRGHREGSSRYHHSPQPPQQQQQHHHHRHHHSDYHNNSYQGSQRNWPGDEDGGGPPPHNSSSSNSGRRNRDYGSSQFIHRRAPPPQGSNSGNGGGDDRYGYREGSYHSYSGRGRNSDRYGPYDDNMDYDRRYSDHPPPRSSPSGYDDRMSRRSPRGPPPPDRSNSPLPPYGSHPPPHDHHHHSPHPSQHQPPPPHHHHSQHGERERERERNRDRDRERGGSRDGRSRRGEGGHGGHHGSSNSSRGDRGDRGDPYYNKSPGGMAPLVDGGGKPPMNRDDVGHPPASVKRTTRVIGTPTPIHVPRAADPSQQHPSSSSSRSRGGREGSTAASVFRGRPPSDLPEPPRNGGNREEDNSQKILMSLRTPTTSFEEKPPAKGSGNHSNNNGNDNEKNESSRRSPSSAQPAAAASAPLSPQDPPQIQHLNHQNSSDANLFFEPQRSPKSQSGPPQPTSSIEMAPSFSLFNQSFDSFGEQYFNVVGPLDSALQSTSFGAAPTGSVGDDKGNELVLHRSMSGDKYSQQLLGGSGSGALTFGMSPSNSFGNGTGSTILLGGQDHRSTSPTQVLGSMYRSYSGGGSPRPKAAGSSGPLDDLSLRGGSFGAPSIGNTYTRSFGDGPPPPPGHYRDNSMGGGPDGPPMFYAFLKKYKAAFKECSFLLPGLKSALLESSNSDSSSKKNGGSSSNPEPDHGRSGSHPGGYVDPSPHDTAIAMRRIASAVCAFGGTIMGNRASLAQQRASGQGQSIFREKEGDTPSGNPSSTTSSSGHRPLSRTKIMYDEKLPSRYYENDNRLSWEFEENPPVEDAKEEEEVEREGTDGANGSDGASNKANFSDSGKDGEKRPPSDNDEDSKQVTGEGGKKTPAPSPSGEQPKMRYRCKLCGQPKQNHTCPYQQSLARSIGANVYPAVNAFTSAEPGILAPALSEMNNFIVSGSESVSSAETSPSRPTPDRMRRLNQTIANGTAQVTPESMRGAGRGSNSPISAMSTGSATPQRNRTPGSSNRSKSRIHGGMQRNTWGSSPGSASRKKRTHSQMGGSEDQGDLLFVESMELKPEQFRIVSQSKTTSASDAFTYPALPLPYAQRKRLSDNLFSLSKQVPQLTDECAAVLREAREKDLWDLAVAELMTQVVVVVNCQDGDGRFEGLRRYLLTLGIAC